MTRPLPRWDAEVDDAFVCTAVRPVAPDTVTVVLAPRRGGTITFEAGQYVTVEFTPDARPVSRCYTIASPPTRPERLAITVKRTAGGAVTPWVHDGGLTVGTTVRVGPPQGAFTLEQHPATAYLFLTAGTGITPALSVLREAYDLGTGLDLVLVHSQRRVEDVPYRTELEWIAAMLPTVRPHVVATGRDGRLDVAGLAGLVPDLAAREVFVCGPEGFRTAARQAALAGGVTAARVHEESFTLDATPPPPPPPTTAAGGAHRVEFRGHATVVDCPPGGTVLDAALAGGVPLAFSCAQGLCGTCKSTLLTGEVDMQHAGGIRPREIAAGKILLCCSRPLTDLVIA